MKINVRNQAFETNSSSSHSVTVSADDMLDQSFCLQSLRREVIEIRPRMNGYGSENCRYVTPEGKLAFLLILAAGGEIDIDEGIFGSQEIDVLPILTRREGTAPDLQDLIDFVRSEHRCELAFVMDYAHASSIFISPKATQISDLLRDRAKLRRLLFSSQSWIDTRHSEDLFQFDRNIESDIGLIFASPDAYVHRDLPCRFELAFAGDKVSYRDSSGFDLSGTMPAPSGWEEPTNSFVFLRSDTADAHIVDLQIGQDEEPRVDVEPESESPFADAFHNLVHYLYLRNENDQTQGYGFKLTVEPGIKAHVRGRRQMKDFWPHFATDTGLKITVACDEETRTNVMRYFEREIRAKSH